jgi:hypothetical protein
MAYVNLSHLPDPKVEYSVAFESLNGGLNLMELDYRISNKESPAMKNLFWVEGVLNSRDGQVWAIEDKSTGVGYTMYERKFNDRLFSHIGSGIYYCNPSDAAPAWTKLFDGVPEVRGTFFHYFDNLYYKTTGAYICISYDADTDSFTAASVEGYTPIYVINASPTNGSGDLYQPENRIQAKKTVKYNAESGTTVYHLPVSPVDSVVEVIVDGATKAEGTDYTVSLTDGTVTFTTAPPVTDPPTNNTVVITYSKANPDAYKSIMDCPYVSTYGGTGDLCIVMGGCSAQPNAYFWNGNNIAMDATYFPFSQYQLAGDTDDPITGFGKQQSYLVVFKRRSVGRTKMDSTTVDDRLTLDLPYVAINDRIGCDLPWSIQLIDNNLVWCNTEQGVHLLKDSSSAYENNITCVSAKVNGGQSVKALLRDVQVSEVVTSFDDSRRYWLAANGHVWLWDYENSDYKTPSWYYFTNIYGISYAMELDDVWHLNSVGQLTHFERSFADYGEAIPKSFRFATQLFGGYDRLKNINSVLIAVRSDTNSVTDITYITDYERRKDQTALGALVYRLVPRNLAWRSLKGRGFASVFRRRPMCLRVRHFTMELSNNVAGQDLSIVSAQVLYNFQGRYR